MGYHALLSLLQFIGLLAAGSLTTLQLVGLPTTMVVFTISVVLGLFTNLAGLIISFVAVEYFHGVRGEDEDFIVAGVLHYWWIFYISDLLGMLGSGWFLLSCLSLVHAILPLTIAIVLDILGILLLIVLYVIHNVIIVQRQTYKLLPTCEATVTQDGSATAETTEYKRRIYITTVDNK
jgi:hypothetical protein